MLSKSKIKSHELKKQIVIPKYNTKMSKLSAVTKISKSIVLSRQSKVN